MSNNNPTGKGGFQERPYQINRKGRPKTIAKLRELVQQIANEPAIVKDKVTGQDVPLIINDKIVTQIEAMLRGMIRDPKRSALFLEYGWGKPTADQRNFNFDMSQLTTEQLQRIANGEDPLTVITGAGNP